VWCVACGGRRVAVTPWAVGAASGVEKWEGNVRRTLTFVVRRVTFAVAVDYRCVVWFVVCG
jgi:hypothetical protein